MSIQDDVKVLGRERARELNGEALRKQIDATLKALEEESFLETSTVVEAVKLTLQTCQYLMTEEVK